MKRVCIVKTGSSLPELVARRGDFEAWIAAGMGLAPGDVEVVAVDRGEPLPDPAAPAGAVVTGSSAMVSERADWSERTGAWLARAVEAGTPVLGICYGHQLLAQALGGRVAPNPRGREIGTVELRALPDAAGDPLFSLLAARQPVHTTHLESVLALPPGARRMAESDLDPNQAFAVGARAWGVQFHPEFDADVTRGYLVARAEPARAEGLDPDALLAGVRDAPLGPRLLRRFAELVRER